MVILITGASHTGKTFLAQRLIEKYYTFDWQKGFTGEQMTIDATARCAKSATLNIS